MSGAPRPDARRGVALVSVLFLLLALLVVSATTFLSAFLDLRTNDNFTAGEEALHVAEAGLEHLAAAIAPDPDFGLALSWPAGEPPFGSLVGFPAPPRTYRVRVSDGGAGVLRALSEGTGRHGTRRRVEAWLRREAALRLPGALVVGAPPDGVRIAGALEALSEDADGARDSAHGVAAESRATAAALPDAAATGDSGLGRAFTRLASAPDQTIADGATAPAEATQVLLLRGLCVPPDRPLRGIVLVDCPLRVDGRLEVEGLLLAPLGLDVRGEVVVRGGAWVAGRLTVEAGGRLAVATASSALDAADALRPGTLPRPAVVGAWREVW